MRGGWGLVIVSVVELLGLAIWVGGLIVIIGAVIPSVFNAGMETGGRILTRVFDGYNRLIAGAIVLLVISAGVRLGATRRRAGAMVPVGRAEMILLTLMVVISGAIGTWLGPDSVALQERAFSAQGAEAKQAAYEAFFRSHSLVRALYVTNLGLGVALLTVKVRVWLGRI